MLKLVLQIARILALVLAAAMLVTAGLCLSNPHRKLFYLIDIFSVPILTGFVVATLALLLLRFRLAGGLAVLATAVMIAAVLPQAAPKAPPADRSRAPVRVVFANLLIRNPTPEKLAPWVDKQDPDIVALVEANPDARAELMKDLQKGRPYVAKRYDMVIVSKYPLSHVRPRPGGFALMTADVATPDGPMTLAVAHLTRPWPFKSPMDQRRQFDRLADSLGEDVDRRFVMVGDFNTPPLASGLGDFTHRTGLHTAPALRGTWPTFLPSMLRVTIDNGMASPDLSLQNRDVGGYTGSDHRPIAFDVYPAKVP
ncbi:MAG: endonuclease/exonuclease/phosphatase family protein [Asticcacaulis sp.]|nr:endonuclease/exonuclease/phosphatase family protein [Asticcacaulis sp.]